MKNRLIFVISFFLMNINSINGRAIENYKCEVETCEKFESGLQFYPNYKQYTNVCRETVTKFQTIPLQYGLCFNKRQEINPECIYAVANTIKTCMNGLIDAGEKNARYFCGFTLMKSCAHTVGLGRFPIQNPLRPL